MTKLTNLYGIPYENEEQFENAIREHHAKIHELLQLHWARKFTMVISGEMEYTCPPVWSDATELIADDSVDFADIVFEECQNLPIKDGVDFIATERGCVGLCAYYSGKETILEIVPA